MCIGESRAQTCAPRKWSDACRCDRLRRRRCCCGRHSRSSYRHRIHFQCLYRFNYSICSTKTLAFQFQIGFSFLCVWRRYFVFVVVATDVFCSFFLNITVCMCVCVCTFAHFAFVTMIRLFSLLFPFN